MNLLCTRTFELTCEIMPEGKTSLRTPNEIVVKLLELKDAGKINVKHAIGQLVVGAKVAMS